MKKVLLTGGTGLIGKESIFPLLNADFSIYALSSKEHDSSDEINWLKCNFVDYNAIAKVMREIQPEYLLHFAWFTGEEYLSSNINYILKQASLNMLDLFIKVNGKRAVFAGTCFEYDFIDKPLRETDTLCAKSVYAQCKNELRIEAETYAAANRISFSWGRIFYVYGHGEHQNRITPYIINSLRNNQCAVITGENLIRDYIYTKDVAAAFVQLLDSSVNGCVNICSGNGIKIKDFALKIADKLGKTSLLKFTQNMQYQVPVIVGNNMRLLQEVGYSLRYDLDLALNTILEEKNEG